MEDTTGDLGETLAFESPPTVDWDQMLSAWRSEPETHPERLHTPWAHPGWLAWNEHAVEVQTAEFIGQLCDGLLTELDGDVTVLETGVGQGYVTRRVLARGCALMAFESDAEWRNELAQRDHLHYVGHGASIDDEWAENGPLWDNATPSEDHYREADLVILDSMDPFRMGEVCMWAAMGKPGSYLVVHDASTQHPSWDGHYTLAQLIRTLQIPGRWLENPRGGFIARRDHVDVEPWVVDSWGKILERVYSHRQ